MTKFNRTQKFTKANIAKVPQDTAIIYKIKSRQVEKPLHGNRRAGKITRSTLRTQGYKERANPGRNAISVRAGKDKGLRTPN